MHHVPLLSPKPPDFLNRLLEGTKAKLVEDCSVEVHHVDVDLRFLLIIYFVPVSF